MKFDDAELRRLVAEKHQENAQLEFKEVLPSSDKSEQRKHVLRHLCAFANTKGGDLLLGIAEDSDGAASRFSIDKIHEADDAFIRRWENTIRDCCEPQLPAGSFSVEPIEVSDQGNPGQTKTVVAMSVEKSWIGPHRLAKERHFYYRLSRSTNSLEMDEIGAQFALSQGRRDAVKEFAEDRMMAVATGQLRVDLPPGPRLVVLLTPIRSLADRVTLEMLERSKPTSGYHLLSNASARTERFNIDGLLLYDHQKAISSAYTQYHWNGCVEAVGTSHFRVNQSARGKPLHGHETEDDRVIEPWFDKTIVDAVTEFRNTAGALEVPGPFQVSVRLFGVDGFVATTHKQLITPYRHKSHTMSLPEVLVDEESDLPLVLRPTIDRFWQAFGFPGSTSYDSDGNWKAST